MIINFEIFEQIKNRKMNDPDIIPEIGDYVILDHEWFHFLNSGIEPNISQIIESQNFSFLVKFEDSSRWIERVGFSKIKYWSKDKEELKDLIISKKYNL